MKHILKLLAAMLISALAALLGNWVGEQLRIILTDTVPDRRLSFVHQDETGEIKIAANPLLSNFAPALLLGLLARRHGFWAFVGGVAASSLLGDRYEEQLTTLLETIGAASESTAA
ncbi:MAG: hypothetical protein Fur0021_39150 [Candidatus Promineifilaceae bacterium]